MVGLSLKILWWADPELVRLRAMTASSSPSCYGREQFALVLWPQKFAFVTHNQFDSFSLVWATPEMFDFIAACANIVTYYYALDDLAWCHSHTRVHLVFVSTSILGWLAAMRADDLAWCCERNRLGLLSCAQTTRVGVVSASVLIRRRDCKHATSTAGLDRRDEWIATG